jgi:hypothetical protein
MKTDRKGRRAARLVIACIASMAIGAQAVPIVFMNSQYDTTALALSGALADVQSDVSPPSALPLLSQAVVVGVNDFAASAAFASSGLLFTQAEADSFAGAAGAYAVAQSHFVGSILGNGRLNLHIGFDNLNSIIGDGQADGVLFVLLSNTLGGVTTTLYNNAFISGGPIDLEFDVPVGGISNLDLLLLSEAITAEGSAQSGQNFAEVTFSGTIGEPAAIPVPATPLLVITALVLMRTSRRKQ